MATARKLPSGSWRVRIFIEKDVTGKKLYKSFTAKSKKAAEKMALEFTVQHRYIDDITFGEAVSRYIESKKNILSPSTVRGYLTDEKNYLKELRNIKLSKLSNEVLQKQLDNVAVNHAPKTVNNARGLITATLKMFPPAFYVNIKGAPKEKKEILVPSEKEMSVLLQTISGRKIELPILLSAFGSLRRGEVCALFVDCVHDDYISIKRTLVKTPTGEWEIKNRPKSFAGYRDVRLPPDIMEKVHSACKDCPPNSPIIGYKPSGLYSAYQRALKKANLYPYKYHALRHYFATFCHSIGIPDQYIMEKGGWEDSNTLTKIYQHTLPDRKDDMDKKIDTYYSNIKKV